MIAGNDYLFYDIVIIHKLRKLERLYKCKSKNILLVVAVII